MHRRWSLSVVTAALTEEFALMRSLGLPTMLINSYDDMNSEVSGGERGREGWRDYCHLVHRMRREMARCGHQASPGRMEGRGEGEGGGVGRG